MAVPVVGIIGGYGAVGSATARLLGGMAIAALRVGGRRQAAAEHLLAGLPGDSSAQAVDISDDASLSRFCAGCHTVINCAGPSYQIRDRVARAALAAGAHYVDPGGDDPVVDALTRDGPHGGWTAILSAGMMPGLSSLLARWLARKLDRVDWLTAYIGTMDYLTPAGAGDYLLSLGGGFGVPQAAWRTGALRRDVLSPAVDVELPFFPGRVTAYPFFSTEAERLVRDLNVRDADWYNVFDGGAHMLAALGRLQGAMSGESALVPAAAELIRAAELDMFGRSPYQVIHIQLQGRRAGGEEAFAVALRGSSTYQLTGAVAAVAARSLLAGRVRAGVHYAASAIDPDEVLAVLGTLAEVSTVTLLTGPDAVSCGVRAQASEGVL
jgi:Saccharopine dehydrogenase NADP binding domain